MTDLSSLSTEALTRLDANLRRERLVRKESWHTCARCELRFIGRADARYCSTRCRVAAHRRVKRFDSE